MVSAILLQSSCTTRIDFDGGTKYEIRGEVTDIDGNSLPGVPVTLFDSRLRTIGIFGVSITPTYDLISQQDVTDQNGEFLFIANEVNFDDRLIEVNGHQFLSEESQNRNYASKSILFSRQQYSDFTYLVSESLNRGANLTFTNPFDTDININLSHNHHIDSLGIPISISNEILRESNLTILLPRDTPIDLSYRQPTDSLSTRIDTTIILTSQLPEYVL
jgi:hypothetical protein